MFDSIKAGVDGDILRNGDQEAKELLEVDIALQRLEQCLE